MLLNVIVQELGPCLVMPIFDKCLSQVSDTHGDTNFSLELPLAFVDLCPSGGRGRSTLEGI
jgi:hypothetical protein